MQLYLECPCTSFPRSFARDFKETYRYPPPSTVYGMLLSLVGDVSSSGRENCDRDHW
jgi:CRISPR-associated protein Cas5t